MVPKIVDLVQHPNHTKKVPAYEIYTSRSTQNKDLNNRNQIVPQMQFDRKCFCQFGEIPFINLTCEMMQNDEVQSFRIES